MQETVICGFVGVRLFLDWLRDIKEQDCRNAKVQEKDNGVSLLHLAVINQQVEVVRLLVLHYKVSRDLVDAMGNTAAQNAQIRLEELENQSLTSSEAIKLHEMAKSIAGLLKADENQVLQYQNNTKSSYRQQRADCTRTKRTQNEILQKEKALQKLKDGGIF